MNLLRSALHWRLWLAAPFILSLANGAAQTPPQSPQRETGTKPGAPGVLKSYTPELVRSGRDLFRQDCAFCHGRDAGGGESGPDLTRSKLVSEDVNGNRIGSVVRNGRPDKGMPRFELSDRQIASLAAFIHTQQKASLTKKGGRKGVDIS